LAPPQTAAAPAAQPPRAAEASSREEELAWDHSVGWEHRVRLPPGQIIGTRDPATYLKLRYAWLKDPKWFKRIVTAGVPLRDRSLIADPAELCDPVFRAVVADLSPDRLFLRIERGLTAAQVECLAQLRPPALYLALCPYESPYGNDCDGDTELAALAGNAKVVARVRALAVAFSDRTSWAYVSKFSALEYLALQGTALKQVDWQTVLGICTLPSLRHLDVLDANFPGDSLFGDIPACVFPRRTYFGWNMPDGPQDAGGACALRRLMVGSMSESRRAELTAACPALKELDILFPSHSR